MSDVVIKVEHLYKQYRLGTVSTGTFAHDINRWWHTVRGKEDPYQKVTTINTREEKGNSDYVWALEDINFEVKQGEVLGIIGRNGAGKSTLLKLLSKVTSPTKGDIKVKGRIASLLEVGTGFHPELTGRENIFLNGAILGMSKFEIKSKFDEIVDFSGVEKYIDTPVKRYSSGMYVRLAFGVAAHLEPEILIVDEVLAVGDAEFQKKCLGKMKDVAGHGRTVLFVSHNMAAVKDLCNRALFLRYGKVYNSGNTNEIVKQYLNLTENIISDSKALKDETTRRGFGEARFTEILINDGGINQDPEKDITIKFKAKANKEIEKLYLAILIKGSENSEPIANSGLINITEDILKNGSIINFTITIPAKTLRTGLFPMYFWLGNKGDVPSNNYPYDVVDSIYYLNLVSDKPSNELGYNSANPVGYLNLKYTSTLNSIEN